MSQVKLHYAHILLKNLTYRRHQKAIDSRDGDIVDYARWTLPRARLEDLVSKFWQVARAPLVTGVQELETARSFKAGGWNYDHSLDKCKSQSL